MLTIYPIDPDNPWIQGMTAAFRRIAIMFAVVAPIAYFLGGDTLAVAVWLTLSMMFELGLPLLTKRGLRGTIKLSEDGIRVVTKNGPAYFPWEDIQDARLIRMCERWGSPRWAWFVLGVNPDSEVVELKLNRWVYTRLRGNQSGTREHGLPLFVSTAALFPIDRAGFIAQVTSVLKRASSEPLLDEAVT